LKTDKQSWFLTYNERESKEVHFGKE
jgi:hypothetical protein